MTPTDVRASFDEDQGTLMAQSEIDRLTDGNPWYSTQRRRFWRPPTDVYETDDHVVIKVEIAGMNEEDFDISYIDRRLIIGGHRKDPTGKLIYQNMEIHHGDFRTEVRIGWALNESDIEAVYEQGFLYVMLPKATQEHHVAVRFREGSDSE
ncbi:MAG: hypothetical protein A2Y73_00500 [Chloroflexi bacterium RBG_13_56_8]|nr:MAG: hypothetical protein A2Y73_00500 [Chloroflexi bacterium RBG_13_56_8]